MLKQNVHIICVQYVYSRKVSVQKCKVLLYYAHLTTELNNLV